MHHNNYKKEWEYVLSQTENANIRDHNGWCAERNFGVSNFGLNPKCLPLSKTSYDVGLHMRCSIAKNILRIFCGHIDKYDNNDNLFLFFEEFWGSAHYSNQFVNHTQG